MLTDLPMTTSERLRAVADTIERKPENFHMSTWRSGYYDHPVKDFAGEPVECGTVCCVAGWAVALAPQVLVTEHDSWGSAGARLLGLNHQLAVGLFCFTTLETVAGTAEKAASSMAACLRRLSKIPEGERTLDSPDVAEALAEIGCRIDISYRGVKYIVYPGEDDHGGAALC